MSAARDDLTRQIARAEERTDDCLPGPQRSSAIASLRQLREERDAMDRDQSDLIAAVVAFAKDLKEKLPDRLRPRVPDDVMLSWGRSQRTLERDRVGEALLQLLEAAGVDVRS